MLVHQLDGLVGSFHGLYIKLPLFLRRNPGQDFRTRFGKVVSFDQVVDDHDKGNADQ